MEAFDLARLLSGHDPSEEPYLEFLRVPSLSVGLYVLPVGATDPQQPHTEDEVYHVVGGRASIRVGAEDRAVEAGAVVFVEAGVDHRFYDIEEDLTVLVFFAPAEGTGRER
jgi:quercetin dioxygenase-like cupin family protein